MPGRFKQFGFDMASLSQRRGRLGAAVLLAAGAIGLGQKIEAVVRWLGYLSSATKSPWAAQAMGHLAAWLPIAPWLLMALGLYLLASSVIRERRQARRKGEHLPAFNVLWVDSGQTDAVTQGAIIEGPYCPACGMQLLLAESFPGGTHLPGETDVVGQLGSALQCPKCHREYKLGGFKMRIGDARSLVSTSRAGRRVLPF